MGNNEHLLKMNDVCNSLYNLRKAFDDGQLCEKEKKQYITNIGESVLIHKPNVPEAHLLQK